MGEDFHYGYFHTPAELLASATANLTHLLAERVKLGQQHVVLDIGCGVGGPALYLAQRYGCRVTGISTSPVDVECARRQAVACGLEDRATFEVRNGLASGYASASFDRVWVMESAHLIEPKNALFVECSRLLRVGGRLALCDIIRFGPVSLRAVYSQAKDFNLLDEVFGRARVHTLEQYAELARAADLDVESIDDISASVAPTFDWWITNGHARRDEIDALIGEAARIQFIDACEVLKRLWSEGTLGYGCLFASKPASGD
jgi:cyclopropane fatty-acyl-phospholipid synthase-like methyltransferase